MTTIAKLMAFIAILYLVKLLLYPFYKPVSSKQKKKARRNIQARKNQKTKEKIQTIKLYFANNYGKHFLGTSDRIRYTKMIERLDLGKRPEEIRVEQIFYLMSACLITWIMFKMNMVLGCASGIFIILAWLYPVDEIEKTIQRKNKNITLEFPAFYSMVYYQYSKSIHIYLADVIRDYLPNAAEDMAEELGVMLDNIDYGEEYALKQLKKRVPQHYIIKFCDIMETRLRGYDNTSQMGYLKNEVDEFRIRALEDELHKREKSNERLQLILIFVLVVYIIIYYFFTIMDALKLFQ